MCLFEVTKIVCLPIIIGILTLAFPILLQTISRIDEKYNTSILTKRFKKEKTYIYFNRTLYISLIYVFIHFVLARNWHWTYDCGTWINDRMPYSSSSILILCTVSLVVILTLLIKQIMVYYDHSELLDEEIEKFEGFKKMTDDDYDVFAFVLNYNICLKDDLSEKNAEKVYEVLSNYANRIYEHKKEFHNRFYFIIEQLNEKLCQQEKLSRIHRINRILTILLPIDSLSKGIIISEKTYAWLFAGLRTQLNYGKTDLVYEYWQRASQNKSKNTVRKAKDFQKIYSEAPTVKNQGKVDTNKENNVNFEEFHLWLAAMVLYKEEYDLLGKLLSFSQSEPTRYPLVPSFFIDILKFFIDINEKMNINPLAYSTYSFSDTGGVRKERIQQGSMSNFLALLLFRLNSSDVAMMRNKSIWNEPRLPDEHQELNKWKEQIEVLQRFVERWDENREYEAIKVFKIIPEREKENNPIQKLDELIKDTEKAIVNERNYKNLDNTPKFYDFTKKTIEGNIYYLKNFTRRRKGKNSDAEKLSNNRTMIFERELFIGKETAQQYEAITRLASISAQRMQEQFSLSFLSSRNIKEKTNYCFFAENAFKAIDKLAPIKKDFIIINFGIKLSKFRCNNNSKINGLISTNNGKYKFMNITIHNFMGYIHPCISKTLVVIPKNKLPYIEEEQPTKKEIDKYFFDETSHLNKMLGIYASITNENDTNRNSIDKFCTAYLSYRYNIYWERDTELAVIKVLDENNNYTIPSNLEDVTPLPLPKRIKNIGNMQQRIHWGLKEAGSRWGRPVYERK